MSKKVFALPSRIGGCAVRHELAPAAWEPTKPVEIVRARGRGRRLRPRRDDASRIQRTT
jgi:hypothetical protein